jgi:hypothetical protein
MPLPICRTRLAMSDMRVVSLEILLYRLEQVLGPNSLLLQRFRRGLEEEDERCLCAAMSSLQLYPPATRQQVEETVMSWLFGGRAQPDELCRDAWPRG